MKYHVYILYSPKFDKYYIGQSANLEARIIAHNTQDKASFTSKYRPWLLCVTLERKKSDMVVRFLRIPGSVSDPDQIQKYRSTVSKAENGPIAELRLKGKTERTG